MAHAQIPNERALAVPREIGSKIGERDRLITEPLKSCVPDDIWPKSIWRKSYRAGDFNHRRRMKFDTGERFAQPESIKKGSQIKVAAYLEIGGIGFAGPIIPPGQITFCIVGFAVLDVQVIISTI